MTEITLVRGYKISLEEYQKIVNFPPHDLCHKVVEFDRKYKKKYWNEDGTDFKDEKIKEKIQKDEDEYALEDLWEEFWSDYDHSFIYYQTTFSIHRPSCKKIEDQYIVIGVVCAIVDYEKPTCDLYINNYEVQKLLSHPKYKDLISGQDIETYVLPGDFF